MADNTKSIPPVPNKSDLLEPGEKNKKMSATWIRWMIQLRDKINLINATIASLSGFSGSGFISTDGIGGVNGRTIQGTAGNVSVTNGDGISGNPVVNLVDTTVTPGTYANTNLTVDEFGRITNATNGSASGAPLTTKGDLFGYGTGDARIPVGTNGYVLTADSSSSVGLSYQPPGTPTLPVTTKGDLLGYSTLPDRIPVGTNGQVLIADSSASTGVSWGANGYGSGTSFPGSPSTGTIFYRSDLNYLCFFDGTRWLTVNEYDLGIGISDFISPTSTSGVVTRWPVRQDFGIYIERIVCSMYSTSVSGTNYWSGAFNWSAADNTQTTMVTIDNSSGTANSWVSIGTTVGVAINIAKELRIIWTRHASAGLMYSPVSVVYRLIIT